MSVPSPPYCHSIILCKTLKFSNLISLSLFFFLIFMIMRIFHNLILQDVDREVDEIEWTLREAMAFYGV